MPSPPFDKHKFIRRLQTAGFRRKQAEAMAEAFTDAQQESGLATNNDIERMENRLEAFEYRMIIRLGGWLILAVGAVATLVKMI